MDIPSTEEELNRKSMDAIVTALTRYEDGHYGCLEALSACRAVFDCTAGLVDREVIELIEESVSRFESIEKGED